MAFTIVDVQKTKEEATASDSSPLTYEQDYAVYFTGTYKASSLVYNADSRLPKRGNIGTTFLSDSNVYCSNVKIGLDGSSQDTPISGNYGVAQYSCTFTQNTWENLGTSPLARPARIRFSGVDLTEVRKYDVEGKPICNSAGVFYQDLPEFFVRGGQCTITQNFASNQADNCVAYSYTTNDSAWYGVAKGNGLLGCISQEDVYETWAGTLYHYYEVTFPITFKRNGWGHKTFDYGPSYFDDPDGDGGELVQALDANGSPLSQGVLLDGSGFKLDPQSLDPIPWPEDEDGFTVYEGTNWSSLSIANPFA